MGKNEKLLTEKVLKDYRETELKFTESTSFYDKIIEKRDDLKQAYDQYGLAIKTYNKSSNEFKKLYEDAKHSMKHKCNNPSTFKPGPWRDFIIFKKERLAEIDEAEKKFGEQKNLLLANYDRAVKSSLTENGGTLLSGLDSLRDASCAIARAEDIIRSNHVVLDSIKCAREKAKKEDPEYKRMYEILKADRELKMACKETYENSRKEVLDLEAKYAEQIYNYKTNSGITIIPLQ